MANLRDVRTRIKSVSQTLQVTKAMQLISTAKLRKAKRMLADAEPYFDRIRSSLGEIVASARAAVEDANSDFFDLREKKEERRSAVIVITSDRGMAGGYNGNVCRFSEEACASLPNPFLVVVGATGQRILNNSPYPILETFTFRSRVPTLTDAQEIADFAIGQYLWEVFDEIHVVYTHMRGAIKAVPSIIKLLPLDAGRIAEGTAGPQIVDFEYLPSASAVFDALAPMYVAGALYGALVEAYASEQSARMMAMDEATKNADEMIRALRLAYNRARQAAITQEVTEIVSGAAALNG